MVEVQRDINDCDSDNKNLEVLKKHINDLEIEIQMMIAF